MFSLYDYTDRVTRQEDGTFRWKCNIDKDYERRSYKATIIFCVGLAIFILILGYVFSVMTRSMDKYWIVALSSGVFILISLLVCWGLDSLPGQLTEIYHLTDTYIETGSGKTHATFSFDRTKKVIVGSNFVELKGIFSGPKIFIPEEDFYFVRDYILNRLPGDVQKY